MKNTVLILIVSLFLTVTATAQYERGDKSTKKDKGAKTQLHAGAQIAAELQSALDVKKAKAGDKVVLKTKKDVKQDGQVVVKKGSKLLGHVTEAEKKSKGNASSKIGVVFDSMQMADGSIMPITATVVSITQATSATMMASGSDTEMRTASSTRSSASTSGGGGLLGGVGNAVGGVVNTATHTTGTVVGQTTGTVGNVTGSAVSAVGTNIKGLSVSQSSGASAQGGAMLSMSGDNLRIEKGTTFHLNVDQKTSVSKN